MKPKVLYCIGSGDGLGGVTAGKNNSRLHLDVDISTLPRDLKEKWWALTRDAEAFIAEATGQRFEITEREE